MEKKQILLDMDGVLSNFVQGAINQINKELNETLTLEEYVKGNYGWNMWEPYSITPTTWWALIEKDPNFWSLLKPFPWAKELYKRLRAEGDVTILTAPSNNPQCAAHKISWLYGYLDIDPTAVMMGHRKYLMAGNGLLIDDYHGNVNKFKEANGEAILVPSNWNTLGLTLDKVWAPIEYYFSKNCQCDLCSTRNYGEYNG